MKELKKNLTFFRFLMGIWFVSVLFSAIMFTLGLMYDISVAIILSCVTGLLSLIGIIYTGYCIIKIDNILEYKKRKGSI